MELSTVNFIAFLHFFSHWIHHFPKQHFGKFWVLKSINGGFMCKTTNLFPRCCQIPDFFNKSRWTIPLFLQNCLLRCRWWDKFDTIQSQQFYSFQSCTPHICSVSFDSILQFLRWKYLWWIEEYAFKNLWKKVMIGK